MRYTDVIRRGMGVVAALGLGTMSAHASVIGFDTPADFSGAPYQVTLGETADAGYVFDRFLFDPAAGRDGGSSPGVATLGSALISASPIAADTLNTYLEGTSIRDDMVFGGPFEAFDEPAQALTDDDFAFLGFKFLLEDGTHFGYAELSDFTLKRFAYQSTPDTAITTGAAIDQRLPGHDVNPVPTPAGVWFFGAGIALIGWARWRKRGAPYGGSSDLLGPVPV
ncbi:hypothetical protein [Salinisphaera sp. Q1T1-3]|uniref:hypothetical protein n=1 Tax=Salinisphaera sp. Q1T1-3 TaxID=2321229 RepID=UPI000E70A8C6|nr:hypothetical protein [Salinisphaera sp. Q1T1-3]RJS93574.1 hypothetical protein D3260_07795 [Salinisphaera sp. Q1T1-3]